MIFKSIIATIKSSKAGIHQLEVISDTNPVGKLQAIIFSIPLLIICLFAFIFAFILDILFLIPDFIEILRGKKKNDTHKNRITK
jgi:hypothetical protein